MPLPVIRQVLDTFGPITLSGPPPAWIVTGTPGSSSNWTKSWSPDPWIVSELTLLSGS